MPLSTRLAELQKRHENLEDELEAAKLHPSIDTLDLVSLKRKKLKLKEEITRLRQDNVLH